jgi:hypothetical protein
VRQLNGQGINSTALVHGKGESVGLIVDALPCPLAAHSLGKPPKGLPHAQPETADFAKTGVC